MKKDPHLPFSILALISVGVDTIPALCVVSKRPKSKVRIVVDKLMEYGVLVVEDKLFTDTRGRKNYMNSYRLNPEYEKWKKWVESLGGEKFQEVYLDIKSKK